MDAYMAELYLARHQSDIQTWAGNVQEMEWKRGCTQQQP
jgi:hypothetical protein